MPQLVRVSSAVLVANLVFLVAGLVVVLAGWPAFADGRDAAGWRSPLDGTPRLARPFAAPASPYGPGHRGVDLAARAGAAVRAPRAGVIGYAGWLAGRPVVTVIHGELRTTYEPVTPSLPLGARVAPGDVIGHLSDHASHCAAGGGACLHWGLRRGSVYVDPLTLLRRAALRLLPLTGGSGGSPGGALAGASAAVVASPSQAPPSQAPLSQAPLSQAPAFPLSLSPAPKPTRAGERAPVSAPPRAGGQPADSPSTTRSPLLAVLGAAGVAAVAVAARRRLKGVGPGGAGSGPPTPPTVLPGGVVDLGVERTRRRPTGDAGAGDPGEDLG